MSIVVTKGMRSSIKVALFDSLERKLPLTLDDYIDFRCLVSDRDGAKPRILIDKRHSQNGIKREGHILRIALMPEDTLHLFVNPRREEKRRIFEVFGIASNGYPKLFAETEFYLEESSYYVR